MKNPLHYLLSCIVLLIILPFTLSANELYPVSLTERVNNSTTIIEGKVVSQFSYIDPSDNNIYTSNRVSVYRLFKGSVASSEIEIITYGGKVGKRAEIYSSFLKLYTGQTGIFFCMPSTLKRSANARVAASYMVYSSMQGFIEYDEKGKTAADPFTTYNNVTQAVSAVKQMTRMEVQVREQPEITTNGVNGTLVTPAITDVSPLSLAAGKGDVLTITGTGFGAARGNGKVQFRNADNGGSSRVDPFPIDYVSWTDTEIKVRVPSITLQGSSAGSGTVIVTNNDPASVTSTQIVNITYSNINSSDDAVNPTTIFSTVHFAQNGTRGGYTFNLQTSFAANTAAKDAFTRAMQSWVCATQMNWNIGATTTTNISTADGINVVRFETGNELGAGILGVCRSAYYQCGSNWVVGDIDVTFDNESGSPFTWQYGPAAPNGSQVDFESVALHELGHGQQLSHVILPGAVMHYAFTLGQVARTLGTTTDIVGGNYITAKGFIGNACGFDPMTPGALFLSSTLTPAAVCSQSEFIYTPTSGGGVTFNWARPTVAGISNGAGSGTNGVDEILVNNTVSNVNVAYNYTLTKTGCNTGTEVVTLAVKPLNTTLAGSAGGAQVCGNYTVQGSGTTYSDASCNLIARVVPSGGSQVAGVINTCSKLESTVPNYNGQPYCARHYDIEPATSAATATGTITLYFTQAEFNDYNANNGAFPDLPANSLDATGIGNLRVTQFHGTSATGLPGSYSGTTEFIDPLDANIVWNLTANRWEVTFNVTGFSGFFVHTGATALPLRLIQFSGNVSGSNNQLQWTTASEQQTAYFDIERSTDGVNFTAIGRVQASGNTVAEKTYQYRDDVSKVLQPMYYYRLKMVDINRQFTHSPVVLLKRSGLVFSVKVMQNPFNRQLQASITSPQQQRGTLLLTDINGRQLSQKAITLPEGSTIIDVPGVQSLKAGTYLLTLITDTEKRVIKVLKQ